MTRFVSPPPLPPALPVSDSVPFVGRTMAEIECDIVRRMLDRHGWHRKMQVCVALDIGMKTLRRRIAEIRAAVAAAPSAPAPNP